MKVGKSRSQCYTTLLRLGAKKLPTKSSCYHRKPILGLAHLANEQLVLIRHRLVVPSNLADDGVLPRTRRTFWVTVWQAPGNGTSVVIDSPVRLDLPLVVAVLAHEVYAG